MADVNESHEPRPSIQTGLRGDLFYLEVDDAVINSTPRLITPGKEGKPEYPNAVTGAGTPLTPIRPDTVAGKYKMSPLENHLSAIAPMPVHLLFGSNTPP